MVRSTNRNRNREAANNPPASAAPQTIIPPEEESAASSGTASTGTEVTTQVQQRSLGGVNARNAFEAYGQQMSMTSITGTLIKFNKGDWVTGDDEDLDEDLELVANMDQLMVGWIKWQDNRPAEQIMGPVGEGYQPPRRNELGDTNQDEWEQDNEGRPRDPWQFSNYIVMKEPGQDAATDNLYTFATSSKGGLGAIGSLCREFGKEMRARPDEYPIVRLGADSYKHPEYGRTHVPVLEIVGWEPKAQFAEVAESRAVEADDDAPSRPHNPPARGAQGRAAARAAAEEEPEAPPARAASGRRRR